MAAQFIFSVMVHLRYRRCLHRRGTQVLWTFARELLRDGLYAPAGGGDDGGPAGRGG